VACERTDTPTKPTGMAPAPAFDLSSPSGSLQAVPFAFIGKAGDCDVGYPAGSHIVTAAWLGGMGLPDNGGSNVPTDPPLNRNAPNKDDPHQGLLLSKNGSTPDCSSSGARIRGVRGMVLSANSALGFDYRNGGHCGAGAPRFNVVVWNSVTNMQTFHFVGGCANDGAPTPAPQDPKEWTRVRFMTSVPLNPLAFPPIPPESRVVSITLIYDEGTDTPTPLSGNVGGVGLAVVDNIFIDGTVIPNGSAVATQPEPKDDEFDREDGVDPALAIQLRLPVLKWPPL
jgi:hypothetical protein